MYNDKESFFRFVRQISGENLDSSNHLNGNEFDVMLNSNAIRVDFQAIAHLAEGHLLGYESLSRGPAGTLYESPDVLFRQARDRNMVFQLEHQCQKKLLSSLNSPPLDFFVFINLEPVLLESGDFEKLPVFRQENDFEARSFVIELTERHHIRHPDRVIKNINVLRERGFRIALDDVGHGYSDLNSIVEFMPDYIKISDRIIRDVSTNPVKQKIVMLLMELAELCSAFVIAEGIESYDDYKALRSLGVPFGQGYLLAVPRAEIVYQNRIQLFQQLQSAANE
jgi:EAL domain-containing protein (putative c-di-GMP-specific phosphodiesterase class I)